MPSQDPGYRPGWTPILGPSTSGPSRYPARAARTVRSTSALVRVGMVHMDVKKLGKIPDGGGWKAHGRNSEKIQRDRLDTTGYPYVFLDATYLHVRSGGLVTSKAVVVATGCDR